MSQILDFDVVDEAGSQHLREEVSISRPEIDRDEVGGDADLTIEVEASKGDIAGEYLVEGDFEGRFPLVCARCLEPFSFATSSRFAVRYEPRPVQESADLEEDVEFGGDAADVEFYSERKIPLRQLASEQLQLAIPMKVVCREDCAGLCPVCGVNRNETQCSCEDGVIDERWKGLQQLRDRLNDEKK